MDVPFSLLSNYENHVMPYLCFYSQANLSFLVNLNPLNHLMATELLTRGHARPQVTTLSFPTAINHPVISHLPPQLSSH